VVAAALGMVVHSAFQGRSRRTTATVPAPAEEAARALSRPSPAADYEFVDLRLKTAVRTPSTTVSDVPKAKPNPGHRDRPEIIRLAREMIKAGTSRDMIKRTLPISDVELALLQTGNIK